MALNVDQQELKYEILNIDNFNDEESLKEIFNRSKELNLSLDFLLEKWNI